MNNLGKSFIVGGLIGVAINSMMDPMSPRHNPGMSKTFKFGMKKFLRAISAMKRMM